MEYWITYSDMNIWYAIKNGNSLKRTGRSTDGLIIFLPPVTIEEHLAVQRKSKARTTLLQSIPDDHITDFHYMDDARDIWNAVKARFGGNAESKKMRKSMLKQEFSEFRISKAEGVYKGYDRMQKILSQLNQLNAKLDAEEINLRFLRVLPSSCFQVALTLKTKGHTAFVSTISTNKKLSYGDCSNYSSTTTYSIPSNSKTRSYRTGNVIEDVLHSFVTDTEPEQQLAYEDFERIDKLDLEEIDLKWQIAMLSVRVHKFEQKARRKIDFDKKESAKFNKQKVRCFKCQQRGHFARECREKGGNDKQRYSSFNNQEIGRKEEDSKALVSVDTFVDWSNHENESDEDVATKEFGMIAGSNSVEANTPDDAGEFTLIGISSKSSTSYDPKSVPNDSVSYDDSDKSLEDNANDLASSDSGLKSSEHKPTDSSCASTSSVSTSVNGAEIDSIGTHLIKDCDFYEKQMDNSTVGIRVEPQPVPTATLMVKPVLTGQPKVKPVPTGQLKPKPVPTGRTKVNSVPTAKPKVRSVPTCKPKVTSPVTAGRPYRPFPVPTDRGYSPSVMSDSSAHQVGEAPNLPEKNMLKNVNMNLSLTFSDSKSVSYDFVSCDDSDKTSEVNTNDFASSDSSVKSSEPKPNDSTSCASTFSVSTSEKEVEIESNVRTPIQEPIIVQDLPSFTCNNSDNNKHTARTSCNKNEYFNKKASHFRKHVLFVSKLCFVCGSGTHLIKDCDFYEKQMANTAVGFGFLLVSQRFKPVPTSKPKVTPVPTGKLQMSSPVPTGRPNRPFPVPTDRGYSPSVMSSWVFNSPMLHLLRVEMVINSPWIMPILGIQELASPKANCFWLIKSTHVAAVDSKFRNDLRFPEDYSSFPENDSRFSNDSRYVVPTGRLIVPDGRYIVPTGSVIVATGRVIVPTGKYNS
nr:ribonuclease H-like domain-containing protein [Tanacetum cinerariifolium]